MLKLINMTDRVSKIYRLNNFQKDEPVLRKILNKFSIEITNEELDLVIDKEKRIKQKVSSTEWYREPPKNDQLSPRLFLERFDGFGWLFTITFDKIKTKADTEAAIKLIDDLYKYFATAINLKEISSEVFSEMDDFYIKNHKTFYKNSDKFFVL